MATNEINAKVKEWFKDTENLINFLSTASYDSFFFSFRVKKGTYEDFLTPEEYDTLDCCEDKWAHVLQRGGSIQIFDIEEEETFPLDLGQILTGATKLMEENPVAMQRIFDGEDDFYDNDAIIQYAIFGEIVYG